MLHHGLSNLSSAADRLAFTREQERRRALRIDLPFPATIRYVDSTMQRVTLRRPIDNLSACGLYLRLPQPIALATVCFVVVSLSPAPGVYASAPQVALRGVVVRLDQRGEDHQYGIALEFDRHRFLYARARE